MMVHVTMYLTMKRSKSMAVESQTTAPGAVRVGLVTKTKATAREAETRKTAAGMVRTKAERGSQEAVTAKVTGTIGEATTA